MITAHHSRDNGYSFRCECGRWFPTLTRLSDHMNRECVIVTHIHAIAAPDYQDHDVTVGKCLCGTVCVRITGETEVLRGA